MRDRRPAGNMLWAVLFFFAATVSFTGCGGDIDNVPADANLSNLTVNPGALQPAFSGNITDYTVDVATSDTSVTVTAKPQDAQATVKINGQVTTSRSISLGAPGTSTFVAIDVTSFNGNQKAYLVTVNRPAIGGNNNLQSLTVSPGPLVPTFIASTTSYTVNVASTVSSVTVTATLQDANASMQVNGQGTNSGQTRTISLNDPGLSTLIRIEVTATNGSQKTYLVTVNRTTLGGNNNLQSLTVSPGALTPSFTASRLVYTVNVASAVDSVTVTAQPQDSGATVSIDGQPTTSRSVSLGAAGSSTEILIDVMAPNGTPKTYTVTVHRAAIVLSGNNDLSALDVSAGALEPPFDPGTTSYSMTVPNATKNTTVTATAADPTATLTINGSQATSGVPSRSIPLDVGPNSILIVVTAQNGTPNPYTVLITRERKNSSED